MAEKCKPLCKWDDKRIEKKCLKFKSIVKDPNYYCKKCGRVAVEKQRLCKPSPL